MPYAPPVAAAVPLPATSTPSSMASTPAASKNVTSLASSQPIPPVSSKRSPSFASSPAVSLNPAIPRPISTSYLISSALSAWLHPPSPALSAPNTSSPKVVVTSTTRLMRPSARSMPSCAVNSLPSTRVVPAPASPSRQHRARFRRLPPRHQETKSPPPGIPPHLPKIN